VGYSRVDQIDLEGQIINPDVLNPSSTTDVGLRFQKQRRPKCVPRLCPCWDCIIILAKWVLWPTAEARAVAYCESSSLVLISQNFTSHCSCSKCPWAPRHCPSKCVRGAVYIVMYLSAVFSISTKDFPFAFGKRLIFLLSA
jgi:hypothetical protein